MTQTTLSLLVGWAYLIGGISGYTVAKHYFKAAKTVKPQAKTKKQIGFRLDK